MLAFLTIVAVIACPVAYLFGRGSMKDDCMRVLAEEYNAATDPGERRGIYAAMERIEPEESEE